MTTTDIPKCITPDCTNYGMAYHNGTYDQLCINHIPQCPINDCGRWLGVNRNGFRYDKCYKHSKSVDEDGKIILSDTLAASDETCFNPGCEGKCERQAKDATKYYKYCPPCLIVAKQRYNYRNIDYHQAKLKEELETIAKRVKRIREFVDQEPEDSRPTQFRRVEASIEALFQAAETGKIILKP